MTISGVSLSIIIVIFVIMYIRHVHYLLEKSATLIKNHGKILDITDKKTLYHGAVLDFVVESLVALMDYVQDHGTDADKEKIYEILGKYKK